MKRPRFKSHTGLAWAFGLGSAGLMSLGYALYIEFIFIGEVVPNTTSWLLWALGGFIEAWSFYKIVQISSSGSRQVPLSITPLICAFAAIAIAMVGLLFAKFGMPERWELIFAGIDIAVVVAYFTIKELTGERAKAARVANALMVIDIFVSFIPIWVSTWLYPAGEQALTWSIWTVSYLMLAVVGYLQIHRHWTERAWLMIYPITSALFHGAIAVIVLLRS